MGVRCSGSIDEESIFSFFVVYFNHWSSMVIVTLVNRFHWTFLTEHFSLNSVRWTHYKENWNTYRTRVVPVFIWSFECSTTVAVPHILDIFLIVKFKWLVSFLLLCSAVKIQIKIRFFSIFLASLKFDVSANGRKLLSGSVCESDFNQIH